MPDHGRPTRGGRSKYRRMGLRTAGTLRHLSLVFAAIGAATLAPSAAQTDTLISYAASDGAISVPLDAPPVPARLRVLIDGDEVIGPFRVEGERLIVPVPRDLTPGRHDLVIEETGIGGGAVERFLFDVPGRALGGAAILSVETGVRDSEDVDAETFATGSLGVDLTSDDRQTRLAFRISRPEEPVGDDIYELNSVLFETTRAAFGQDLTLQFGDHNLVDDDFVSDGGVRRGLSLTVEPPSEIWQASVFALRASSPDNWENWTGLEDTDDRLHGIAASGRIGAAGRTTFSLIAYDGRDPLLPSGEAGETRMVGVGATQLAFDDRVTLAADVARSDWNDGADAKEADALRLGAVVGLLPLNDPATLSLGIEGRWIETDFYSALNPGLISGEEGVAISLDYISDFWTVGTELDVADTNYAGPADAATDRLTGFSFDVAYDPNEFTGTWLNGTTFFVAGEWDRTARRATPAGAPDPNDNIFRRLTFGADRFRTNEAWSLAYTVEDIDDRTDANADEWGQYIDAVYSLRYPTGSVAMSLSLGDVSTPAGRFAETDASISLRHIFSDPKWEVLVEAGLADFENPSEEDGRFGRAELSREIAETAWIVMEAGYGEGTGAPLLVESEGWQVGLFLRADLDLMRSGF